jgi:hypothetical protein
MHDDFFKQLMRMFQPYPELEVLAPDCLKGVSRKSITCFDIALSQADLEPFDPL